MSGDPILLIEDPPSSLAEPKPARLISAGLAQLRNRVGLDRAIAFTALGRLLQGLGSIVTVLLIVRILSPVEQGYYYALWSLVALQSVFELGFSFVILQIAAHERAHLHFHQDGSVTGSRVALSRLASVLQKAVRWYACAAVFMGIILLFVGSHFLASHPHSTLAPAWHLPLGLTVLACMITFAINPVLSFLEGCGQVAAVAHMRLFQSIVSTSAAWAAMLSHHGLFSPSMVLFGQGVVAGIFLFSRRALLLPLLSMETGALAVKWRMEVWPFQWKIAVSWLCDYFIFQLLTPALFLFRGPVEAGRMGVSMSIVMQLGGIVLIWMTTKAAPFGTLVAQRNTRGLELIFFRTLKQSVVLLAIGGISVLFGVALINLFAPAISTRFVSWPVFLLLLLTAVSSHVVQSEALFLRAHKCEPFLLQSILMAAATCAGVFLLARPWGTMGVALAYFAVMGIGGAISATWIFQSMRKRWAKQAECEAGV